MWRGISGPVTQQYCASDLNTMCVLWSRERLLNLRCTVSVLLFNVSLSGVHSFFLLLMTSEVRRVPAVTLCNIRSLFVLVLNIVKRHMDTDTARNVEIFRVKQHVQYFKSSTSESRSGFPYCIASDLFFLFYCTLSKVWLWAFCTPLSLCGWKIQFCSKGTWSGAAVGWASLVRFRETLMLDYSAKPKITFSEVGFFDIKMLCTIFKLWYGKY